MRNCAFTADATEPAALTTRAAKTDFSQTPPMFLAVHGTSRDALCAEAADREFAEVIRAATADAVK